jgi:RNA recognition motif-containing protein
VGYVEFETDDGLQKAIEHNEVEFRGRKLSVEKSDPSSYQGPQQTRGRGRGPPGRGGQGGGPPGGGRGGGANPPPPVVSHRRGGHLQLVGDPTAFIPRNIKGRAGEGAVRDETPKTNEMFRNLFKK